MRHRLGGSAAAFQWGTLTYTNSKAGCLRAILLKSRGINERSIPEHYKIIGELNELRYLAEVAEKSQRDFTREMAVKAPLTGFDNFTLSGRADFVYHNETVVDEVIELKAVSSYAKQRDVIDVGNIPPENLAQLITYMSILNVCKGKLIYTRWKNKNLAKSTKDNLQSADKNDYEAIADRTFEVNVNDYGRIIIDHQPSKFTIYDVYSHQNSAAKAITEGVVKERPLGWEAKFGSPCSYCVFSKACDRFDSGDIVGTDAYVSIAKECVLSNTVGEG